MKVKLGDVCEKASSNIKQSDIPSNKGVYPIYGASGLLGKVNFFHQEKPYIAVIKDGAGIGRAILCPEKSSVIGTLQYLLPRDNVLPQYLYYVICHMHLEKYFTGATIPHIYFKDYKNEPFNLVSRDEQQRIINVLGLVENIIDARKKEIVELDNLVKSRFVEMFSNERQHYRLNEVCKIITDGTHQPPEFVSCGIPFIFVSNIVNNEISYNTEKYITQGTYNSLIVRTPIEMGDIILSTVGSYGHPAVVKNNKKFLFQRHIAYLKPKHEIVDSDFLHSALLSSNVQQQIDRQVKGIAQKTLNLSAIKQLVVPIPKILEQRKFARLKNHIDKSKLAVQKSLEELETLKNSLMQQYFD